MDTCPGLWSGQRCSVTSRRGAFTSARQLEPAIVALVFLIDWRGPGLSCEALIRIEGADRSCGARIRLAGPWFVQQGPDLFSRP